MMPFNQYVDRVRTFNLHERTASQLNVYRNANSLRNIPHLIFYGPPGVGKYSQSLYLLSGHDELTHRKKLTISDDNNCATGYYIWGSNIHFEIDMQNLSCKKWHTIYQQIIDATSSSIRPQSQTKQVVILCLNFHRISNLLLHNFYTYMQSATKSENIIIRFLFVTESTCFIPQSLLYYCDIVSFTRPSITAYSRVIKSNNQTITLSLSQIQEALRNDYVRSNNKITNIEACQLGFIKKEKQRQCIAVQNREIPFIKRRPVTVAYMNDMRLLNVNVENIIWEILKQHQTNTTIDFPTKFTYLMQLGAEELLTKLTAITTSNQS